MAITAFWMLMFGCIGIAALLGIIRVERWRHQQVETGYQGRTFLYDGIERLFLGHLVWAVGRHVIIFGKVRLADIVRLPDGLKGKMQQEAFDRVARQHIDFLLCDKKTTKVLCAVELYDPGAHPKKALIRARFIDKVLKDAGIPLARFPRSKKYLSREIESAIRQTLALSGVNWAVDESTRRAKAS